ncbi:MAG: tRNA pseudouridine(38-40) synthase TruA [Promethearchaeota archaeon]
MTAYIGRLFYLGTDYYGSQLQPGFTTIQGELIRGVEEWSKESHDTRTVQLAGRTDRGVHSLGQIVLIRTEKKLDIDRINSYLPDDIVLWASVPVDEDFNPRFDVLMRHYRYYLCPMSSNLNLRAMQLALDAAIGLHDFHVLSKPDGTRPTTATILNASLMSHSNILKIDLFGTNFLWKLVRKIISLLVQVGEGQFDSDIITKIIRRQNEMPSGIAPAPPESLVLVETITPIRMKQSKYALRRLRKNLDRMIYSLQRTHTTLSALIDDFL